MLADRFDGKRLNSPNDIVCARDGSLWFTDPTFGIAGHGEGQPATPELPHAVYRLPPDGPLQRVIDDLKGPNRLAFSPDESQLYLVESRAEPHRRLWAYRIGAQGALSNKRLVVEAADGGAPDGIAVDVQGPVWCGHGSNGRVPSAGLDGVRVYRIKYEPDYKAELVASAPSCPTAARASLRTGGNGGPLVIAQKTDLPAFTGIV